MQVVFNNKLNIIMQQMQQLFMTLILEMERGLIT